MPILSWSHQHSVFDPEMDAEHQEIFLRVAGLQKSPPSGRPELAEKCTGLIAEIIQHFSHEERLMRASRFPGYSWHKGQHDTLRKRVALLLPRVSNGEPDACKELVETLAEWLDRHTGVTDRMMASHLRNRSRELAETPVRARAMGRRA